MKNKILSMIGAAIFASSSLFAQVPTTQAPTQFTIKGEMTIDYNSRINSESNGSPKEGFTDLYTFSVNVADSAIFRGKIENRPFIKKTFGSNQTGQIAYSSECDIVNPKNPAQTKNVGRFYGIVPIDENNVYRFTDGNLKAAIFGLGNAKAFESKFSGYALGKPPTNSSSVKESLSFFKSIGGKTVATKVTNYDKMEFKELLLASGPVSIYPETTLNGPMIYDYGRSAWHFKNIGAAYVFDNKRLQDTLTGDIRWVESPNRKSSGEGEYVFDIRVNEPAPNENAIFAPVADENAFFAEDTANPSLIGTMKYKDVILNGKVTRSTIKIDLVANKLNKQQTMYMFKMLFFVAVVPFNAE